MHTMTNGDAIAIRGVTKRFGGYAAVDDLTLDGAAAARSTASSAPTARGKTTTLRMIMHILLPDQGRIEVLGDADDRAPPATASATCPRSAGSTRR